MTTSRRAADAFQDRGTRNRLRLAAVVAVLLVFVGLVGYLVGALFGWPVVGLAAGVALAGVTCAAIYVYGEGMVLAAAGARPVTAEHEPRLHNVLEGLCLVAGIAPPRVYVVGHESPNALAAGRRPGRASVAVTRGMLETMNRVELEGVIAHELVHLRHRDVAVATMVAGLCRVSPVLAPAYRLAIAKDREYLADAEAARITRYPPGLSSALQKIAATTDHGPVGSSAIAHVWLVDPSGSGRKERSDGRPPIEERIRILEEM